MSRGRDASGCFLLFRRPPSPTLFPYTTLFRSVQLVGDAGDELAERGELRGLDHLLLRERQAELLVLDDLLQQQMIQDRKSTRLNSSHTVISYAVFCLKKKKCGPCSTSCRPCRWGDRSHVSWSRCVRMFSTVPAPTESYTLSLHDALPICSARGRRRRRARRARRASRPGSSAAARASGGASGPRRPPAAADDPRSEEHTSELQSHSDLVCRLLLEKKKVWAV